MIARRRAKSRRGRCPLADRPERGAFDARLIGQGERCRRAISVPPRHVDVLVLANDLEAEILQSANHARFRRVDGNFGISADFGFGHERFEHG